MSKQYDPVFRSYRENRQKILYLPCPPPQIFFVYLQPLLVRIVMRDFYSEGYRLTSRRLLFFLLNYSIFVVFIIILLYYIFIVNFP